MAFDTMLSKAPVSDSQLHRIEGENPDAGKAALGYEEDLLQYFHLTRGLWPQFDLVLLGLGVQTAKQPPSSPAQKSWMKCPA
jgi:6-phosphogluconolactonase/glucosamine-6-phosphate isomerase/deaminase